MDVIGFGALNVDYIYEVSADFARRVNIRPGKEQEGTTLGSWKDIQPQLERERLLLKSGGGSAANTVAALARMGFETGYIGKVGNDPEGEFLISTLKSAGVDTCRILKGKGRSGIVVALQTRTEKDRSMEVFPGENSTVIIDDLDIAYYINQSKRLHLTSSVGDQSFETQIKTLEKIDPQVLVSFDGGELYARRGLRDLKPFLKRSQIIFFSKEEVTMLTGKSYKEGARELLSFGPKIVVATLGARGCWVFTKSEDFYKPAFPVLPETIKDTVGAGDVFAAGFLAGLLKEKPLRACARFANLMAAESIKGKGRTRYPTQDDLEKYL